MSLTKAVARGVGYPLLAALGVLLFPVTIGVAVATNYRGAADRFSRVPGVSADGSVLSGTLLGVVALAILVSAIAGALLVTSGGIPGGDVVGGEPTPTDSPVPPTETPTATPSVTPTAESDVELTTFRFCNKFEGALRNSTDLDITEVTSDGTNCQLVYVQEPPLSEEEISRNVSIVAGSYSSAVKNIQGGHPNELNVEVVDSQGNLLLDYYIRTEWAREEIRNDTTSEEHLDKVFDTIGMHGEE